MTKNRDNLKLPEHPLDLNTLVISKLVALLTKEDPMLNLIIKFLQNKVDKVNANSHYLNQFIEELHESDGLFYMHGKLLILFTLGDAVMKTLLEADPG